MVLETDLCAAKPQPYELRIEANIEASRNMFERPARDWHEMSKAQWATVHADAVLRSLERDVLLSIGSLPFAELKPPIVLDVLPATDEALRMHGSSRVGNAGCRWEAVTSA